MNPGNNNYYYRTAVCDFVIFPPRWMVAENTFRPVNFINYSLIIIEIVCQNLWEIF